MLALIKHVLNPIQDGPFRGCSQMRGVTKRPPVSKIFHTSCIDETWQVSRYTLPKEDPKNT